MDCSVVLTQIYNNQIEIIDLLSYIDKSLSAVVLLLCIAFLYVFIRNIIKN